MSKKDIEIVNGVSEDQFKDYAGINAYRFINARNAILQGKMITWSWTPFLLAGVWAGYRKHWYAVFSYCFCIVVLGLIGIFVSHAMLGLFGLRQYIVTSSKTVQKIKLHEQNPERIKTISEAKGGVSALSALVSLFLIFCSIAINLLASYMLAS